MKAVFRSVCRRSVAIVLTMIMMLSVCIVGITPAFAADMNSEIAGTGASGSGILIPNGATIKINGNTIPEASSKVNLNFTDGYSMKLEAIKKGQYFLKWEITGGTEGVDYEYTDGSSRISVMSLRVLTPGINLTLKPIFTTTPVTAVTFAAGQGGYVLNGQHVLGSFTENLFVDDTLSAKAFSLYQKFDGWMVTGGVEGVDFEFVSGSLLTEEINVKILNYGADIIFTANFTDFTYTVVFEDYNGTVLNTQSVVAGAAAIPPEDPEREGFAFAGWSKDYSVISEDITITATYTPLPEHTLGLFSSHRFGGTVTGSGKYTEGSTVTVTATPYEGYVFTEWITSTIGGDKVADRYSATTTVTLTMNTNITAYFEKVESGGDDRSLIDLSSGTEPYVYASKNEYRYGEPINIVAQGGNWVGIYKADVTTYNNTYSYYYYTDGFDGQAVDIRTLPLNSRAAADPALTLGKYQAVLFGSSNYSRVLDKVTFEVVDENYHEWSEWNYFSTDKKNYVSGEPVMVTGYTDRQELNPWICIVKKGSPQPSAENFSTNVLRYAYLAKNGSYDRRDTPFDLIANSEINKGVALEPGEYDVWLFRTGSYDYPRGCTSITVHSGDGTVTMEKDTYHWYEDISVNVDYSSYKDGAWVGIYNMAETRGGNGADPTDGLGLKAWFDIDSQVSWTVDLRDIASGSTGNPFEFAESFEGEYGVYLFATSDYSNIQAKTTFTITGDVSGSFSDGYFNIDNLTDGFANGGGVLEVAPDSYGYIGATDLELFWADADGKPLEDYAALHKVFVDKPVIEFDMYAYTFIPEGAKTLAAYIGDNGTIGSKAFVMDLPDGCAVYEGLDEGVLSEFQIVSDIHIVSDKVTHYADGTEKLNNTQSRYYSHSNFIAMLNDIAEVSPSSSGIFVVGDVVNNGFKEEYDEIMPLYNGVEDAKGVELPPLYVTLGNHDTYVGADISPYINFANSLGANITQDAPYYSKDINGYKYIFLAGDNHAYYGRNEALNPDRINSIDAEISDAQLEWLDAQLLENEKNGGKPVFVMLHQALYQSVAGTLPLPAQNYDGVVNYEELETVLNKYNNVIYLSGHSHWELNSEYNMIGGNATLPVAVNTSSVNYPYTDYRDDAEQDGRSLRGAEGFYVRVYEDKSVFMGRDFLNNKWLPSACYVMYNKDVQADDTATMYAGKTLTAQKYNLRNTLGRNITFTSSDTSVATVSADGTITALKPGAVTVTILAHATNTEVIAREKLVVTVKEKPEAGDVTSVELIGIDGNWNTGITMEYTDDPDVVTTEISLEKGIYRFKIRNGETIYGNDGVIIDTTTTTSQTGWRMLNEAGQATLAASGGTYIFNYNASTNGLVIIHRTSHSGIVHDETGLLEKVMSGEPYVHSNKNVYKQGEAIYVTADGGGWVGLFPIDVPAPTDDQTKSIFWYTVTGGMEGKAVDIRSDNYQYDNINGKGVSSDLPAGDYALYLFEGDGYNLIKTDTFSVVEPDCESGSGKNYLKTSRKEVVYREDIYVTADVTSAYEDTAWVGVYPAGSDYRTTPAKYMYLVKDYQGVEINLTENSEIHRGAMLPVGEYDMYLFGTKTFSKELAKVSFSVISGAVATNKDTYSTFSSAGKTEEIMVKAELYDMASIQVENYITSTLTNQGLVVHRQPGDSSRLTTISSGKAYRFISYDGGGWAYIEYSQGKYGYVSFEYITPTENSDVIFNGYVKSSAGLYAEYERDTKLATLDVNTPISVIKYDNATVKVQAGGLIGYVEHYKLSVSAYAHESNAPETQSSSWVGIWPAGVTPGSVPSYIWYYHYYDTDGAIPADFDQFCNMSVSLSDIAGGDGTYYGGSLADTLPYMPAGEYVAYLFGDSGYTNVIDTAEFTVVDNEMTGGFKDGIYEVENLTDGFANGTVAIEIDADTYGYLGIADATLYWADENGVPLPEYNALTRQHVDKPVVIFDMYAHTFIPEGAACFMAYVSCERVDGTIAYRIELPEGCETFENLDEGVLSEFQIVSDLHITSNKVTSLPNGGSLINGDDHSLDNWHYQSLLYDVTAHSPNSAGVFVNGDVANNGLKEEYEEIAKLRAMIEDEEDRPYPYPDLYVNMGNHDAYPGNITEYVKYAASLGADVSEKKPYYSLMVNGYKYIFLAGDDSSYYGLHDVANHDSAKLSDVQLEWLDAELLDNERNNGGKPVFVMIHQAVPGTVAGSLEGQWGYDWGVVNHEELTDILEDYNNVIMLSGHSHWELDAKHNHNPGTLELPVTVNTASVGYLWTDYDNTEEYMSGSQGYYVRVYEDKVVFLGREFIDHKWIPSACYVFYNEDVSVSEDRTLLLVNEKINASDYVISEKGRTLSYESSAPSVAKVDKNGTITALSEGVAYITVNAEATNTEVVTRAKIMVVVPKKTTENITYLYNDRNGKECSYTAVHNFNIDEILGYEGNGFTPYAPSYISGEDWINSVLYNAPFITIFTEDVIWRITPETYDEEKFTLTATQTDKLFTITCQAGDAVEVIQKHYNDLFYVDARDLDKSVADKGFWYSDVDDDGKYTQGTDLIITYGPYVAYRATCDMNINYAELEGDYDFNITIDAPAYGHQVTNNADGTNSTDKVTADYTINILTPFFYGDKNGFVPSDNVLDDPTGQHVTVESLRKAGYTVKFGVLLEQVGSFDPESAQYPTFEDALEAAKDKNYGTATDSRVLAEVIENYKAPVMSEAGTYCTLYDTSDYKLTNKNRFGFAMSFNNTQANRKKFFNVYSYVTVITPESVKTTYISNVQTLNICESGR